MGIADGMKSITEDIIASHEARVRGVRERRDEVNELVDNFATDRKHMGEGQAKALADYVETLRTDVTEMMKGFQKDHAVMAAGIRKMLASGEADRAEMSQELRKSLSKYVAGIASDTKAVLDGFAKERIEMSNVWHGMVATLAKSAGIAPRIKAVAQAAAVESDSEAPVVKKSKKGGRKKRGKKSRYSPL